MLCLEATDKKVRRCSMSRLLFLLTVCCLTGCQAARNSIETGLSTHLNADSPVIEKVNVDIKFKKEW